MLQESGFAGHLTVAETLRLWAAVADHRDDEAKILERVDLAKRREVRVTQLSGGERRRLDLAMAVYGNPELLFLDEPTTGLDIEARQGLWRAIRALVGQGSSVLLTTHYLEEAEALADRVLVLNRGRVVAAGPMREVRALVSQRRIRCVSTLDAQAVAGWPQVRSARREGDHLELVVDAAEPVVRRLLELDAGLCELEIQRAGLAEAFLELTQGARTETTEAALQQEAA